MNQERQPIRHTGTIKSYGTYIYFYLSFIFVTRVYTIMYVWDPDILTDKHYIYLQIRVFQKECH
jgi:hypothetical protein